MELARKASRSQFSRLLGCGIDDLERFAALVEATEREACARICEQTGDTTGECPEMAGYCADAIRMRSND